MSLAASVATKLNVHLTPTDFRCHDIGHLGLFEARHEHSFWARSLLWLRDACNPWPLDVVWREKAGGKAVSAAVVGVEASPPSIGPLTGPRAMIPEDHHLSEVTRC